jgi:hypothetical protein
MVPDFLCEASETLEESTDGTYFSVPDDWNIRTGNAVVCKDDKKRQRRKRRRRMTREGVNAYVGLYECRGG